MDAHATWHVTPSLSLLAHANGGLESNDFGTSSWLAGALYARILLTEGLYLALRGDDFKETLGENDDGTAGAIFWPAEWVASGTGTLDYRPHDRVSFRLEFRHDQAEGEAFFGGDVEGDGTTTPFVPNEKSQDPVTLHFQQPARPWTPQPWTCPRR